MRPLKRKVEPIKPKYRQLLVYFGYTLGYLSFFEDCLPDMLSIQHVL